MIRDWKKDGRKSDRTEAHRAMAREGFFSFAKLKTSGPVCHPIAIAGILLVLVAGPLVQSQSIEREEEAWQAFPAGQVHFLEASPFRSQMEVNAKTLLAIGVDRALYAFRFQAGLPTLGAKPLRGWATPEPSGAFPGFFEGHYLSAISLHAATDDRFRPMVDYMVTGLGECQRAMGGEYLFASPEEEFAANRLDGVVWYRVHKLLEGLIAAHVHAQNKDALSIALKMADWIQRRVQLYGDDFQKVKEVEYGGMTEAMENLAQLSNRADLHELALRWEQPEKILRNLAGGGDYLEHANTLAAKIVGAAKIMQAHPSSSLHHKAVKQFWENTCGEGRKIYPTGGTSIHEGMPAKGKLANTQNRMPQETCVSYNLMKVTQSLYLATGDPKYMDFYERSLWNAILGSQDPETGWKTYYQPIGVHSVKDFRSNETGCFCCNGTGLENPSRSASLIYTHQQDRLRINLAIASRLDWPQMQTSITQETSFPFEDTGTITVQTKVPRSFTIELRIPTWTNKKASISVNDEAVEVSGRFVTLQRTWQDGDRIRFHFPQTFTTESTPDDGRQFSILRGPLVMTGIGTDPRMGQWVAPSLDSPFASLSPSTSNPEADSFDLEFQATDHGGRAIRLKPYFLIAANQFFTATWNLVDSHLPEDNKRNLALGKPTLCSTPEPEGTNLECFMRSSKAVDGLFGGDDDWYVKWFPNGMSPQWIIVDLQQPEAIGSVRWIPAKEDSDADISYRYRIESSTDGENWQILADASENQTAGPAYQHPVDGTARWIRLTTLPNPAVKDHQARPKIAELQVLAP
ncbi:MAG: beta-L-arabinofuranosidase domain-containing protein [Pirellulaceae bacterium]